MPLDYDKFYELILQALHNVPENYESTTLRLGTFNNDPLYPRQIVKFGERTFCYELYSQMQLLIKAYRTNHPDFFPGYFLQGEVTKRQLRDLIEHLNLHHLDANYSPDLLFHEPEDDGNAFVFEVKTNPNMRAPEVVRDIYKLIQFIDRYRYRQGIFICLNTTLDYIKDIVQSPNFEIQALHQTVEQIAEKITILIRNGGNEATGKYDAFTLAELIIPVG